MIRKIAILLIVLFSMVGLRDVFNVVYFYCYQDYIIEAHCVNKEEPEKLCYGKCYLQDQLDESIDSFNDSIALTQLFDHFELKVMFIECNQSPFLVNKVKQLTHWNFQSDLYHSGFLDAPFHPPQRKIS